MSPEQLLGQLEASRRVVIADMEAGAGNLTRMDEGSVDLVLLVTEPSPRSIEVARRARAIIGERKIGPTLVVANKVRGSADLERIRTSLPEAEVLAVPEDPMVLRADREGRAPIDIDPGAPAAQAVADLARRLAIQHEEG